MSPAPGSPAHARRIVVAAWLVLAAGLFAVAAPRAELPGLYYDEAFMGQQAKDFFEPERGLHHPGSTREIELFGRPFPLRNAVYLGALKSQLLLPAFAAFGPRVVTLRLATLGISLVGLLFFLLWLARVAGAPAALLTGALAAADPSYLFLSLYEWGPFSALLLCRGLGLWALTEGWLARRSGLAALGGLALGLGVFGRADFAVVPGALAAALAWARPELLREAASPARRRLGVAAAAAAALGASPMLLAARDILATGASPIVSGRGDLAEKLRVLWSLLDGSHFLRLMEVGGRFDAMFQVDAPAAPFGWAAGAALLGLGLGPGLRRGDPLARFVVAGALGITAATLALPGAVRAHHLLNALPFPHAAVAVAAVALWRGSRGPVLRAGVGLAVAAVLASGAALSRATFASIEASGGRGRWSSALAEPARLLEAHPETRGVSLDWGFHEPLLFLTRRAALLEPIWTLRATARRDGAWRLEGGAGDLYFVHDQPYDLFGLGPPLLAEARSAAAGAPGAVEVREHRDREGGLAFLTVQVQVPHAWVYRDRFRLELHR